MLITLNHLANKAFKVSILIALGIAGAAVHDKAHSRCQRSSLFHQPHQRRRLRHPPSLHRPRLLPRLPPTPPPFLLPLAQQNNGPRLPKQRQRCLGRTFFFFLCFFADLLKLITFIYLGLIHSITTPRRRPPPPPHHHPEPPPRATARGVGTGSDPDDNGPTTTGRVGTATTDDDEWTQQQWGEGERRGPQKKAQETSTTSPGPQVFFFSYFFFFLLTKFF
jgi:hypothetical protein